MKRPNSSLVIRCLLVVVVVSVALSVYYLLKDDDAPRSRADKRSARQVYRRGASLYPRSAACAPAYQREQEVSLGTIEDEEPLPVLTTKCESIAETERSLRQALREKTRSTMEAHRLRLQQQGLQGEVLAENRLVIRNFISASECATLIDVAKRGGILGISTTPRDTHQSGAN
jgi:hypothetical protein